MTFTEAAIEVLRQVGKPLHYKKITEIAIEKNLLSHVGKTPETTMSSRLATMVRKDRGDAPITKVKPGVFALRDFPEEVLDATDDAVADVEPTDAPELSEVAVEVEAQEVTEDEPAPRLPGAEVFPEEEDDDDLILANLDDKQGGEGRSRGPRRRGRRRKEEPSGRQRERSSTQRERPAPRDTRRRGREPVEGNWDRKIQDNDATGGDLADAIEAALSNGRRDVQGYARIAEALVKSGRLSGSASALAPTLAAAVRGDNARVSSRGARPRFRELSDGIVLTNWDLPSEALRSENDVLRSAKRQREAVRRAFVQRLSDLPDASLLELLAAWLNSAGVRSIRGVRPGSTGFHLAGTLVRGPEEVPLAIAIHRGRNPLDRDSVADVRGALHHYGHAQAAWLITLGQVDASATEEARAEAAAPCAIYSGDALGAAMEEAGVGVKRVYIPLATLDIDLLEGLTGKESRPLERDGEEASNGSASTGNRRRRGKRRSRRRGAGPETDRVASSGADASAEPSSSDSDDSPTPKPAESTAEPESKSSPEPTEVSGETEL